MSAPRLSRESAAALESGRPWTKARREAAHLRATCAGCSDDSGRPEFVALRSWHTWGHSWEGAPPAGPGSCRCGTPLGNGPRFWHCGGCHETFAGERAFMSHRRGKGDARACQDMRDAATSPLWEDEHGTWHLGPRQGYFGADTARRSSVSRAAEKRGASA